jgi:hypothetical protein
MEAERDPVPSRKEVLAEKFRDKRYRDSYVATSTRGVLALQMRNFRGDRSQADFGVEIGKRQTVVSRLENSAYGGWSLRTMLEVARKLNVAVFCRFVDFPTFLKLSDDLSDEALFPASYGHETQRTAEVSEPRKGSAWNDFFPQGEKLGTPVNDDIRDEASTGSQAREELERRTG